MIPRWLIWLVRVLPSEDRDEVLRELAEQRMRILHKHGRIAFLGWAMRQPVAVLASRDTNRGWIFSGTGSDLLSARRSLMRRPVLATTVILTIAVSVAAVAAVASILDAVILRPLPYPDADRLVWLATYQPSPQSAPFSPQRAAEAYANPLDVVDWAAHERHLVALTPFETFETTIQAGGRPVRVDAASLGATAAVVLGIQARHGRLFVEADHAPGARAVVVSHRLWRSAFGGDPALVGRTIDVGGESREVVGILPDLPIHFPTEETDLWFPLRPPPPAFQNRGGVWQRVVARVDAGVAMDIAAEDIARVARELEAAYPESNKNRQVHVVPYRDGLVGTAKPVLTLLLGAVALVLLIACTNIGQLLLLNAHARGRELAVRAALGATSGRLARLLVVESALLGLIGGVGGLLVAPWCLQGFLALYPDSLPAVGDVRLQWSSLIVALTTTFATAVVAVLPALLSVRAGELQMALRSGDRGGEQPCHRRLRAALVVVQVAVSTALLIGGGLLVRTFINVRAVDVGFDAANVLTFNVALGRANYPELADEARFHEALIDKLRAIPGVVSAGSTTLLPFTPGEFGDGFYRVGFNDVYPNIPIARLQAVTPGYFESIGLTVRQGRAFTRADAAGSTPVVIVDEALERRDFDGGAVGRQIRFRGVTHEIVGVVASKRHSSLRENPRPEMYYPRAQVSNPRFLAWFAVRSTIAPDRLLTPIRSAVSALDPSVAVDDVNTFEKRIDRALAPDRFRASLIGSLAVVALLLSGLGLYGLIAFSVAREARAIAIRMALGATRRRTVMHVVIHVLGLTATGAACGGLLAYVARSLVSGFLAGVAAFDPMTVGLVAGLLVIVSVAAVFVPATRASRVDPALVLRS